MSASAAPAPVRKLLAPISHLALVLLIFAGITAYNFYQYRVANRPGPRLAVRPHAMERACAIGIAEEWLLLLYVWAGVRRGGGRMRDLTGGRWTSWKQVGLDLLIAAIFWSLWSGTAELMWWLIGKPHTRVGGSIHFPPVGPLAIALWLGLSATAGFCEEAIYRGYLQKQFQVLSGKAIFAVLAQSLIFGISHVYQGYKAVVVIALLGLEYGLLAWWRRNLRSAMLSHAWSDMVAGYFKFLWSW